MTALHVSRRRAEEFNSLVEGTSTSADVRHAEALELVASLRRFEAPQPRPEFVSSLREELMTAADSVLLATPADRLALPPRRTHRERRIAAVVGGAAILGATTSMAVAAQSALPGDMLYPVKRAIENAHTGISFGADAKGSALLANASGRLDEVSALSSGGDLRDATEIADTLNAFTEQASEASDLLLQDYAVTGRTSSVTALRNFAADSMDQLATLQAQVPSDARTAIVHAARVLTQIDVAAHQACPSCAGAGIDNMPASLASAGLGAPETAVVPAQTVKASGPKHHGSKHHGTSTTPEGSSAPASSPPVPVVEQPGTPAGTNGPSDGPGDTPTSQPGSNPVQDLTEGLTGGGGDGQESASLGLPSAEDVGDDVSDGVKDPLKP